MKMIGYIRKYMFLLENYIFKEIKQFCEKIYTFLCGNENFDKLSKNDNLLKIKKKMCIFVEKLRF